MKVNFSQTLYKHLRKSTTVSHGVAFFSKPSKFRWILTSPSAVEWIYDGENLFNYQPKQKKAMRYGSEIAKGREMRQVVDMVLNFDTLFSVYQLQATQKVENGYKLILLPLKSGDLVKVDLQLDLKHEYINQIVLYFRGQNKTTFDFMKPNKGVINKAKYALPQGVKISNAL